MSFLLPHIFNHVGVSLSSFSAYFTMGFSYPVKGKLFLLFKVGFSCVFKADISLSISEGT